MNRNAAFSKSKAHHVFDMAIKNNVGLIIDLSFTLSDQLDTSGIGLIPPHLFVNNIILYTELNCALFIYIQAREQSISESQLPDFKLRQMCS